MEKFKSKPFYAKIWGNSALFTDPMSKGMGEKFTYQVPTYQALKGLVEACYWKPTLYYVIDSVKIMRSIQTEAKGTLYPMRNGDTDLFYHTYLKDVEYLVKYHFEWNDNREDLVFDRNEKKHEQILIRSLKKGGRRDIFLGTRECLGYMEYIQEKEFEEAESFYKGKSISMGIMFHSFVYPDEAYSEATEGVLTSNFAATILDNGVINFVRPEECTIRHNLGSYTIKNFTKENFTSASELLKQYDEEGVTEDEPNACIGANL